MPVSRREQDRAARDLRRLLEEVKRRSEPRFQHVAHTTPPILGMGVNDLTGYAADQLYIIPLLLDDRMLARYMGAVVGAGAAGTYAFRMGLYRVSLKSITDRISAQAAMIPLRYEKLAELPKFLATHPGSVQAVAYQGFFSRDYVLDPSVYHYAVVWVGDNTNSHWVVQGKSLGSYYVDGFFHAPAYFANEKVASIDNPLPDFVTRKADDQVPPIKVVLRSALGQQLYGTENDY